MTMDTYTETKAQTDSAFAALVEGMLPDLGNFWLTVWLTSRATMGGRCYRARLIGPLPCTFSGAPGKIRTCNLLIRRSRESLPPASRRVRSA